MSSPLFSSLMKRTLFALCPFVLMCITASGCGDKVSGSGTGNSFFSLTPEHYDVCVLIDHSGSTRTDAKFNDTLRQISKVYLSMLRTGPQNEVCLQHGGIKNEVIYDGKGRGLIDLRDKLNALANGKDDDSDHHDGDQNSTASASQGNHVPLATDKHGAEDGLGNGSPIVETLLAPALAWVNDRPSKNQKLVIIVSDLVPDPTKYQDGTVKRYLDPAKFKWSVDTPKNVHLRFYMVNTDNTNKLQDAWRSSGADMRFFEPGYSVDKGDLTPRNEQ